MRPILIAVAVLCLAVSASAEEVIGPNDVAEAVAADVTPAPAPIAAPAVAPAPVTNLSEGVIVIDVPYYWDKLSDALVSLLGVAWQIVLVGGLGWIVKKLASKERVKEVLDALSVGVSHAWDDMGRELKHAAADRKLTADERQKLQNKAYEHAKTILSDTGKKLLEGYTWSKVVEMISAAVQKRKAIASIGGTSAVPTPAA